MQQSASRSAMRASRQRYQTLLVSSHMSACQQAGKATAGPTFGMHLATWAWGITIRPEQCLTLFTLLERAGTSTLAKA